MHKRLLLIMTAAVAGATLFATPGIAQQKTAKACEQEWRANKAANQAAGITEKAYVEKCRAAVAPATAAKPAATSPALDATASTKTAKQCEAEWRANKAANQAAGVTEKAYVEKCRAGVAKTQPPAPAAPAARTAPAPAPKTTAAPTPAAPPTARTPAAGAPAGAGQYATEAQAKSRCPRDTVVWVNLDSKIYHYSTSRNYGHTKDGAYMCERDTAAAGFRAAKNEKHP